MVLVPVVQDTVLLGCPVMKVDEYHFLRLNKSFGAEKHSDFLFAAVSIQNSYSDYTGKKQFCAFQ